MIKRVIFVVLLFFFLLLSIIVLVSPHHREIYTIVDGLLLDFNDSETQGSIQLTIEGTAEYRFFKLKKFDGHIRFSNSEVLWSGKPVYISYHDGLGHINTYNEADPINTFEFVGYVAMDNFEEMLILLYDEGSARNLERYIVAPAMNRQQSIALAKKLSSSTFFSEIDWDK